ncbi:hypothetical protein A4H97_22065 [Niastella yeongjuensis]|uniref:Outer membrane protein beta-barrel domain-containing protein n=1 Tax=Niastella yeongjuensis TaxID=354355 RepID=A0A1V9F8R5_9BACT|nr:hypothetical protein [Niastella yeongjuensis]OQP54652.1 hypothetical protein A4H97_22065 [Niastella yeongjuensis]SEO02400.1 hypothetical protein SAMN05660816_01928 [Niastella yeongjuensis]
MPIKYFLFFALLTLGCVFITSAQEIKQEQPAKKGCSCSFSSINQLGTVGGRWGIGPLVQSVNGVRYKTWFAGIGVGIDGYKRGSFPVFLDVRKDLFSKSLTPFIYADAGLHFPGKKIVSDNQWFESEYSTGFYSDAGIGYKLGGSRPGRGAIVSAGYSYKYIEREYRYKQSACVNCTTSYTTYNSYLHRISIKIGWQL